MTEHSNPAPAENAESIVIPTPSGEEIAIDLAELPDVNEMLDLLVEERVPLINWIQVAKGYYVVGRFSDFVALLDHTEKTSATDGNSKDRLKCMDMLAAYYVRVGMKTREDSKRRMYFSKATILYTTADKLMMYDTDHLIGRAYFCLVESVKWEQAKTQFDYVINLRANDIVAIIGMGLVYYCSGSYNHALGYFKRALRYNPNLPAEVRLGMGHCFLKLKKYAKARACFERVLSLDASNIPARIALASCIFHDAVSDKEREVSEAILKSVHAAEKENPVALIHLANVMFLNQGNFSNERAMEINSESESLAWQAYECNHTGDLKAEAVYMMARHSHVKREFDRAATHYQRAIEFSNGKFVLPYFGLGQIQLGKGEFEQAIASFEKVLVAYPDNTETMKILGSIYARWQGPVEEDVQRESKKKAFEYLTKVYENDKDDVEVILELAQLQETSRPHEALKKYQTAMQMLENHDEFKIPAEMYSNIGTLHFQLGNFVDAREYYEKAREVVLLDSDAPFEETSAKMLTLDYNLGRVFEVLGRCDEAEEIYEDILLRKRNFTDAILRIGCLLRDKGDTMKAQNRFKEALSIDTENPVPWLLIANLHMEKGETKVAQSNYEQVLKTNKTHAYALVGLGNVWLDALYNVRTGEKDEKEKIKKFRDTGTGIFTSVLKHHPRNAWAANGIACILVHRGKIQDARDLFSQVREAAPDLADVFLNLAHVHMETKQYTVACQMYKNFMKRNKRQFDVQLLQYAARASWKATNYNEAKDFLQRAIIEAPDNLLVRYNMAIILQAMASFVIRDHKATILQLEGAIEDLKEAERAFSYLTAQPDSVMAKFRYVSRSICQREARSCKDLLAQANQFYDSACRKDAKDREQQEQLRAQRLEQVRKNEEAEQERLRLRREQEEELRRQRAQIVEKTKEILYATQTMEVKETKKKSGGKKKREKDGEDFVNDSSDMGDWRGEPGAEGAPRPKRDKKRKRKRDMAKAGASGSEDEDQAERKQRRKKQKLDERQREREEKLMKKGKIKSKAVVSSSSSSEDSDAGANKAKTPTESDGSGPSQPAQRAILSDSDSDGSGPSQPQQKKTIDSDEDSDVSGPSRSQQTKKIASSGSEGEDGHTSSPVKKKTIISSDEDS